MHSAAHLSLPFAVKSDFECLLLAGKRLFKLFYLRHYARTVEIVRKKLTLW